MIFKTLENISVSEIAQLFNEAFSDYFVKVNLTPELVDLKINSEDIRTDLSIGLFDDTKPVAFMFHGIREISGKKVAYNGGTGVLKEYRRQHATVKMYKHQISILKANGVNEIELEVIDKNMQAIKSYKKVGFRKTANLDCFKGTIKKQPINPSIEIREIRTFDKELFYSFWEWKPSWQNSTETIEKLAASITYAAFFNKKPVGYLVANPKKSQVLQFGVSPGYRKHSIGSSLFRFFADTVSTEITVNNIDDPSQNTQKFLKKIGLRQFLTQHKMTLKI